MKTISQIAKECDLEYNAIHHRIKSAQMILDTENGKLMVNKCQEDYLHQILYFEGKINEITLESKINKHE